MRLSEVHAYVKNDKVAITTHDGKIIVIANKYNKAAPVSIKRDYGKKDDSSGDVWMRTNESHQHIHHLMSKIEIPEGWYM
jgi:hypothetical protein